MIIITVIMITCGCESESVGGDMVKADSMSRIAFSRVRESAGCITVRCILRVNVHNNTEVCVRV